ncbi:MAG: hypothetical protein H0S85_04690 [Desulfovibrionaceae bacterium]|jgi:hypothetical protein|nr:hypothetical protein [Desulfovibrionaceae bacterium]
MFLRFVVRAAHSKCGPITIQASSADEAAALYHECCGYDDDAILVWHKQDYHLSPERRPPPLRFESSKLPHSD